MTKTSAIVRAITARTQLESFTAGFVAAVLWSSSVEVDGETVNCDELDISTAADDRFRADCQAFYTANETDLAAAAAVYGWEKADHDYALTRNGHGAGYWDGELPEALGARLSDAARKAGPCELYVGDDGSLYTY